jgi:CheY-like chemotaxis protein
VGRLAGGIAHDFNNLLTVISAHADFLLHELPEHDQRREDALAIRHMAGHAADLTRQLLLFARKQAPERRVVDLNRKLSNIERMLSRTLGAHIDLVTRPTTAPALIHADPALIEQVIVNLALNARDAMPNGGRLVLETSVTISGNRHNRTEAMLTASDTGVGMDSATRAQIFEPFFTTKEQGKGTGLGLATVHAIVREAGGTIAVESELGRGTTFRLRFPLVRSVAPVSLPTAESPEDLSGTETVLVVEDQDAVREVAARALRTYGYRVLVARHGHEALRTVRQHRGAIDLVLSDLVMPEMHGHQLAASLRALAPDILVIFMTGFTEAIDQGGPRSDDTLPLIRKPFRGATLASAIRDALDAR